MNWKTNYWTVLFALAAVFQVYNYFSTHNNNAKTADKPTVTTAVDTCPVDSISYIKAMNNISRLKRIGMSDRRVKNGLDLRYFALAKCELREMLTFNDINGKNAIAYLALDSIRPDSMLVDLYFKVTNPQNKTVYFDFTNPCPPMCGLGGGGKE